MLNAKSPAIRRFVPFLFWSALFAIAYAQSPLYTSNQNTYFLHGFACADVGELKVDWLANTLDATPMFSGLVCLTLLPGKLSALSSASITSGWEVFFYGYYALLMGVYLYGLLGVFRWLSNSLWEGREYLSMPPSFRSWGERFFVVIVFMIHSAGWRFMLIRILGPDWAYILEDGFAGQRMLGPVFQPSVFAVFLLVSVVFFLIRRYTPAVLTAALAALFHPTYLLCAAALTSACMVQSWRETRRPNSAIRLAFLGLLAVFPAVWIGLGISSGSNPAVIQQAQEILTRTRLPHHALISAWPAGPTMVKLGLIAAGFLLAGRSRMRLIMGILILIGGGLTLLQALSGSNALALLFPWRVSVLLIPLAVVVILSRMLPVALTLAAQHAGVRTWMRGRLAGMLPAILILMIVGVGGLRFCLDIQRKEDIPERGLFKYVSENLQPGQVALTPVKVQDFRLATGSPVYVDFKSNPYQPDEVIEWSHRLRQAQQFFQQPSCAALEEINPQEFNLIVLPRKAKELACTGLTLAYQDDTYVLYSLDKP